MVYSLTMNLISNSNRNGKFQQHTVFIFQPPSTCTINRNHVWENLHLNTMHEMRDEFILYAPISIP